MKDFLKKLVTEKVKQAEAILKELNIDVWLTFVRESSIVHDPALDMIAGLDVTWQSCFIIDRRGNHTAIVGTFDKKSVEDIGVYKKVIDYKESIRKPLLDALLMLKPEKVAINYSKNSEIADGLTHGMYLLLKDYLEGTDFSKKLLSSEEIIGKLRGRKSETEISLIKDAIKDTLEIYDMVAKYLKPGLTEIEIAEFMKNEVRRRGLDFAWEEWMCPSVFTGPETAGAHYGPTNRKVEEGHVLNMDFGIKKNEYCSDIQRTFYIRRKGEESAPEEVMKGFNTIVEAIERARLALKPGVTGYEIDKIARDFIVQNGYDEYPHALGHQVGRFAHDGSALLAPNWERYGDRPFEKIEEGMVFTIEPRLFVKNYGVVTIEEMVVVTKDGAKFLGNPQKELILV